MAKMRVNELAKELGVENKEIVEYLHKKNIKADADETEIDSSTAEDIRKEFSGKAGKNADQSKAKDGSPKKKNLAFVIRPQNSKNSSRIQGSRNNRPARQGQNVSRAQDRPARSDRPAKGDRTVRTERAGGVRPVSDSRPTADRQLKSEKPAKERTLRTERPAANTRFQGDTRNTEKSVRNDRSAQNIHSSGENRQDRQHRSDHQERFQDRQPRQDRTERSQDKNQGGRSFNSGRQNRQERSSRDQRNSGSGSGQRTERREPRRDEMNSSIVEQQKNQRNKAKDKERDNKKKEYRDEAFEEKGKKGRRQKQVAEVKKPQPKEEKKEEQIKQIVIPEVLTIKELADKMKVVPSVIIKKLFLQGKVVTVNQEIDYDTAEEIAMDFDVLCEKEEVVDVIEELLKEEEEDESLMIKRPPVVCVMGHVDHGKTSLLDAIRHTNVTDREAGGITQHIGAYVVDVNGEKITFLDTPGHEAFTAMRMRGANATDIAILVVAADDGVMPQTVEAINHAKAAGVEIIVAINKIDKPSANVERVKQELTEYELIPEDWGGSTIFVPVSAHTKEGIPELLDMILLTAEMMELKANPNRAARGLIIEAKLDKGKGSVATVLVQKGTLHVGDAIAAGCAHGHVRAMMDDKGKRVKEAGPSQPVEILGLNDVPNAGEVFVGCNSEKEARNFAETFIAQHKVKLLEDTKSRMSLDDLFNQIQEGNLKELDIVVKADVQGSVEALKQSLLKLSNDEVVIKVIHGGVGAINESDVILASASNAIIIGFNVRPDATAKEIAEQEGVDVRLYRVIYNAIEDVEAAMKGMLDPIYEEKVLGHAEVRQTFKASGVGTIAGAYVQDGMFERNCSVRLIRDGIVIFDGAMASLKRFKDDVKEVKAGYECGIVLQNFNDIKEGDTAEAYKMVEIERK